MRPHCFRSAPSARGRGAIAVGAADGMSAVGVGVGVALAMATALGGDDGGGFVETCKTGNQNGWA